jgi:DNA-binding transcriptional LysR family regulator
VPGIVQRFRAAAPDVEIELHERPTAEQLRLISAGVVDVGLVRPPIEDVPELDSVVVLRERTVAALPSAHKLASLRRVPLKRLAAEPLVLFPRDQAPGFHDLLISSMVSLGAHPRVVQYAPEMLTIIGLVAAGIGASLVPASVARLALEGVTYRPVSGAPHSELIAVTRADDDSPLVRAFMAHAAG